jgi:hypothetical protein
MKEGQMKKDWHGIIKILEVQHLRNSKVIWEEKNINNILHSEGENFFLKCCFVNDGSYPPGNYYFGLDNRSAIAADDLIEDLAEEPSLSGYGRIAVDSTSGFSIEKVNQVYRAAGSIITFSAIGGSWGPVRNLFLSTSISSASDNLASSILLASAQLSSSLTLTDGDSVNMRMALSLQDTNG